MQNHTISDLEYYRTLYSYFPHGHQGRGKLTHIMYFARLEFGLNNL